MELSEEDTSKVFVNDLPNSGDYYHIIHDAQEAGKALALGKSYEEVCTPGDRAWHNIMNLMARCIARGMRLEKERTE